MLTCDLFVRGYNGEVSRLYPKMAAVVGNRLALDNLLLIDEGREAFDRWYTRGGVRGGSMAGTYDENGEPVLLEGMYFENPEGERWYIDRLHRLSPDGVLRADYSPKYENELPARYQRLVEKMKTGIPVTNPLREEVLEAFMAPVSYYVESSTPNLMLDASATPEAESRLYSVLGKSIFLPSQHLTFMEIVSGNLDDRVLEIPGLVHPETKKEMTYLEYYLREKDRFLREQEFLREVELRLRLSPFVGDKEFRENMDSIYAVYLSLPLDSHVGKESFYSYWKKEVRLSDEALSELWKKMTQRTGSTHNLVRANFGELYRKVSDEVAYRLVNAQAESVHGPGAKITTGEGQQDITELDKYAKSIVDFSEKQLGMQRLGRKISIATGVAENEVARMKHDLNEKMTAVARHYWNRHPEQQGGAWQWLLHPFRGFLTRVDRHNRPYLWMFEKSYAPVDPSDPLSEKKETGYTGAMVARFSKTEEEARDFVYRKTTNGDYLYPVGYLLSLTETLDQARLKRFLTAEEFADLQSMNEFMLRLSRAMREGVWLSDSQKAYLGSVEARMAAGQPLSSQQQDFYDDIMAKKARGLELTKKQERYREFIERSARHLVARALVVQEDSGLFRELEQLASTGDQEAKAKIELYDYLYRTNLSLSRSNDSLFSQPMDRAFMPQLSMNVYETYNRTKSLMKTYLRFVVNLEDTDLFGGYEVEQEINGVKLTKTWDEWVEYYNDPARSKAEKLRAPFRLKKMYDSLEAKWANNTSPDPMHRRQLARSFSVSNSIPFRTVAKKKNFSINAGRLFMVHFESLIFRKHHDGLVPLFQAMQTHYENFGKNRGKDENFSNVLAYIRMYADRYFFGRRAGDFNNSVLGNMLDQLLTATSLAYLGVSPKTSFLNLGVGMNESLRQKVAEHGWTSGAGKWATGVARMKQGDIVKDLLSGRGFNGISRKAKAFIQHFNLETYTNIDIENQQDFLFGIADHLMLMQQKTELLIRGVSIIGEMSEKEWNSFDVDDNGFVVVKDRDNFPKVEKVKEWNYYVSSVQGNYTPEGRMNYHNFVLFKSAMLFKTWMVNYLTERLRPTWTDMYGKKRQGYYMTLPEVIWSYTKTVRSMKDFYEANGRLEDYQVKNLRKIAYDLSVYTLLVSALSLGDTEDEHPGLKFLRELMLRYQTQLFFLFDPKEVLGILSRPFPWMGMIESWAGAAVAFTDGKFGKSGELVFKTIPGNRVYDFGQEVVEIGGE